MTQPYPSSNPYQGGTSYASVPADPPPTIKKKTWPLVLLIAGIVLGVISIALGGGAVMSMLSSEAKSLTEINPAGSVTVDLEAHRVYGLYSSGMATCEAQSPSGTPLNLGDVEVNDPGKALYDEATGSTAFAIITTTEAGSYTITCMSPEAPVYLGEVLNITGTQIGLIATSGILGFIAFVLFIVGLIWLIVRVSHNRKVRRQLEAAGYGASVGAYTAGGVPTAQPGYPAQPSYPAQPVGYAGYPGGQQPPAGTPNGTSTTSASGTPGHSTTPGNPESDAR